LTQRTGFGNSHARRHETDLSRLPPELLLAGHHRSCQAVPRLRDTLQCRCGHEPRTRSQGPGRVGGALSRSPRPAAAAARRCRFAASLNRRAARTPRFGLLPPVAAGGVEGRAFLASTPERAEDPRWRELPFGCARFGPTSLGSGPTTHGLTHVEPTRPDLWTRLSTAPRPVP